MEAVSGQTDAVVLCFLVFLDLIASFLVLLITSKSKLLCLSSSICLFMSELCHYWLFLDWPLTPALSCELEAAAEGDGGRADSLTFAA